MQYLSKPSQQQPVGFSIVTVYSGAKQVTSNGFLPVDNTKETVSFYFYFIFCQKPPSNILNLFSDITSIYFDDNQSCSSNNFYKKSRLEIQKNAFSGVETDLE